jgi:hypothetical protein
MDGIQLAKLNEWHLKAEFKRWFYSRGEFYKDLEMKFYVDGEPYFSSQGAECSLRDYKKRKELVKDIFTCKYISGGETEYDGGIWQRKETSKMITFKQLKESFYQPNWTLLKFKKLSKITDRGDVRYSGFGSVMIDEEDGTYTIYPDQCGTPHIFEPIEPEKIEEIITLLPPNESPSQ